MEIVVGATGSTKMAVDEMVEEAGVQQRRKLIPIRRKGKINEYFTKVINLEAERMEVVEDSLKVDQSMKDRRQMMSKDSLKRMVSSNLSTQMKNNLKIKKRRGKVAKKNFEYR